VLKESKEKHIYLCCHFSSNSRYTRETCSLKGQPIS
jgi:hypothetical protein